MSDQQAGDGPDAAMQLLMQEPAPSTAPDPCPTPDRSAPAEFAGPSVRRPVRKPSHPNPARPKGKVTAEKVLHAFNTWAFKREQPDDPLMMLQVISRAMALGEPIPFVLYWGKGPRSVIGAPDIECLETSQRSPAGFVSYIRRARRSN
jgi:L-tyrosine isonitrile synthase